MTNCWGWNYSISIRKLLYIEGLYRLLKFCIFAISSGIVNLGNSNRENPNKLARPLINRLAPVYGGDGSRGKP